MLLDSQYIHWKLPTCCMPQSIMCSQLRQWHLHWGLVDTAGLLLSINNTLCVCVCVRVCACVCARVCVCVSMKRGRPPSCCHSNSNLLTLLFIPLTHYLMFLMSHIKEPEVGGGTHLLSNQDQQIRGLSVESANHSQSHSPSRRGEVVIAFVTVNWSLAPQLQKMIRLICVDYLW